MQINCINSQNFGMRTPTVLSKSQMQTALEKMTGISRGNKLATSSNWMYNDNASYSMVLMKYLLTKMRTVLTNDKISKVEIANPTYFLN